jgi:hypothetical protein
MAASVPWSRRGGEVDDVAAGARRPVARGEHQPRGLGGDRGLEVDLVEQQRLHELGLDARRGDA